MTNKRNANFTKFFSMISIWWNAEFFLSGKSLFLFFPQKKTNSRFLQHTQRQRSRSEWRLGFHLFAFCVETSAFLHNQTQFASPVHFFTLLLCIHLARFLAKIVFVNSRKTDRKSERERERERHLVRHWIYENCINISSTITVARQSGGGFIRLLSLASHTNVD